jgi:hypothetical protein
VGSYLNTFVGPALICAYKLEPSLIKFRACTNEKCEKFNLQVGLIVNFCENCGTKIAFCEKESNNTSAQQYSIIDCVSQRLELSDLRVSTEIKFGVNNHVYTPDKKIDSRKVYQPNPNYICVDLSEIDVEKEKEWFRSNYAKEIKMISSYYTSTEVKWIFANYMA